MPDRAALIDQLADDELTLVLLEPSDLDSALLGFFYDSEGIPHAVYNYRLLLEALQELHGWDMEEVSEYAEFNVLGLRGQGMPVYILDGEQI